MDKPKGAFSKNCMYLGIFAQDPKAASKTVSTISREALHQILKTFKPQAYLAEQEHHDKSEKVLNLEQEPSPQVIERVQKDFTTFQSFNPPKDNYHITSLFMGKNAQNPNKKHKQLIQGWKSGQKVPIRVEFIVYVPGHILAGYTPDTANVDNANQYPHMTLLLKDKASAVESNAVLEQLAKHLPQVMKQRPKKVLGLRIPYGNICKMMFVIDLRFQLEGITGDNISNGKK